jgi:hypothetical protein
MTATSSGRPRGSRGLSARQEGVRFIHSSPCALPSHRDAHLRPERRGPDRRRVREVRKAQGKLNPGWEGLRALFPATRHARQPKQPRPALF